MPEPTMADTRRRQYPWERADGETEVQYASFVTYRDMGRVRTVAKVAEQLNRSRDYLYQLSRKHAWTRRAEAWDREQDREFNERVADRRRDMAIRTLAMVSSARIKLAQAIQNLDPGKLTPSECIRWFEVLVRIERETLGLPGQVMGHTGAEGGPIEMEMSTLTDEQRKEYLLRLVAEAQARATRAGAGFDTMRDETSDMAGESDDATASLDGQTPAAAEPPAEG